MSADRFQEVGIIIFITFISEILGGRFDPLPSELRSVLSSNQLGEGPPIFHEYHALLPNFRGDYGIKSKIIKAIRKDPLYTGSDTLIVPLYIPEGAIPFRIHDRTARSGKPSRSTNFRFLGGPSPSLPGESSRVSINRPIIRRIGSPNRRGHVSIRKIPTQPSSFIRPWMRRRHGVSSTKPPDNVEEVKLSKILSHVADFHKQIQRSRQHGSNSKTKQKSTPVAKQTATVRHESSKLDATIAASNIKESLLVKKENTTEKSESREQNTSSRLKTVANTFESLSSPRHTISQIRKLISNSSLEALDELLPEKKNPQRIINTRISPDVKRRRTRLKLAKKGVITKTRVIPTTTPHLDYKKLPRDDSKENTTAILGPSAIPNTPTANAARRKSKIRLPVWPRVRQPIVLKGPLLRKETEQHNNKNIIDRVLNSAVNQTLKNETDVVYTKNISAVDEITVEEVPKSVTNSSRPRDGPEKPSIKITNNSSPKEEPTYKEEDFVNINKTPIENKGSGEFLKQFSKVKVYPHFLSSTLVPIPDEITKEVDEKLKGIWTSNSSQRVTNYITTSTPKMSWPLISNRKRKRKRKPHGEIIRRFHIPARNSSKFVLNPSAPITTPKLKSAQDIVLEKLSSLMTASAESGAQSLDDIARDIEVINQELSALGIHIIDAEFDGHKLHLNQPQITSIKNNNSSSSEYKHFYTGRLKISPSGYLPSNNGHTSANTFIPSISNSALSNTTTVRVSSSEAAFVPHQIEAPNISLDSWRPIVTVKPMFSRENSTEYQVTTVRYNVEASKTRSTTVSAMLTEKIATSKALITVTAESNISNTSHPILANNTKLYYPTFHFRPTGKISGENNTPPKAYNFPSTRVNSNTTMHRDSNMSKRKELYAIEYQATRQNSDIEVPSQHYEINKSPIPTVRTATKLITDDSSEQFRDIMDENERSNIANVDLTKNKNNAILIEIGSPATTKKTNNASAYLYFLSLIGLLPLFGVLFIFYNRRHRATKKSLPEREEKSEGHTPPINHVRSSMHAGTLDALPAYAFEKSDSRTSPWELPRSKLRITSVIGEGNFGVVWKAEARNLCDWDTGGGPTVLVAVKGVKENAGQKEKADLLRELSIMQHLGQHSNIVTLLGCCTSHEPYYLVMEYVMFGKLLTFLRENRSKNNYFNFSSDTEHLTSKDLTRFAYQISSGCEYLQTKGIIHRDLAARNILVDHNKTCKIADFGLARSIKDTDSDIYEQKSKGPLPIRWMALESLYMNIFTHKSDVWSFGILCWEIVTLGSTPYPGISAREVMRRVREGYRLERPDHCRGEFYQILASCWNQDLNKRPSFATVKTDLRELLDHQTGWIDLENFQESTYYSMHQNNEERL